MMAPPLESWASQTGEMAQELYLQEGHLPLSPKRSSFPRSVPVSSFPRPTSFHHRFFLLPWRQSPALSSEESEQQAP